MLIGRVGMDKIKQLREQRASLWEQMKALIDISDRNAEQNAEYDRLEAKVDEVSAEIDRLERHEAREARFNSVDRRGVVDPQNGRREDGQVTYESAFRSYMSGGMASLDSDERRALAAGFDPSIKNALSVGTAAAGGYLVPKEYREDLIVQMKAFGNVQAEAQVIETESGANLAWPTMNDTGNVGRLLAENTQLSETDVVVGTKDLDAYMYTSDLTRVSLQLAQDAAFDVEAIVRAAHAERIGRITNQHFTTGTGTAQPDGIVTSAVSGVTAAGVAAITADELLDLQHSVDPAYRDSPRAKYMLTDTALKSVRKLKDLNGAYLWQPSMQAGAPGTLWGKPYVINQDMAVPATGVKSVLYGDFYAGYVIRIVLGIQVITFQERYLDYLQLGHASYMRADGTQQNAAAYKALTQA